jgi:hypothetical protein
MRFLHLLGTMLLFASSAPAAAQEAPKQDCTLHVWTTNSIKNDISGLFPLSLSDHVETRPYREKLDRGKTTVTQTLLTPELQLEALKSSSIGSRLGITPDRFIVEPDPDTQRSFTKSQVSPNEACRYGFVFQGIEFQKSVVYGKRILLAYKITDRSRAGKPRNMRWYNSEDLKGFDPQADDKTISTVLQDGLRRVIDDIVKKKLP